MFKNCGCWGWRYRSNVVVQPFGAHLAVIITVVSIVVGGHVLQDIVHSFRLDLREQRLDETFMGQLGKI